MKTAVLSWMVHYRPVASTIGMHALVALLVPGGMILLLALWLHRRHQGVKASSHGNRLPKIEYGAALANAIEWLGDRYLLAQPVYPRPGARTAAASRRRVAIAARSPKSAVAVEGRARSLD
jgi:hypothetical protein